MKKRILLLLLACFIVFGNSFGQEIDHIESMGTWSAPFTKIKSLWITPDDICFDIDYQFTLTVPLDITISNRYSMLKSSGFILYDSNWDAVACGNGLSESPPNLPELTISCLPAGTYVLSISWYDWEGMLYTTVKGESPDITRAANDIGTFAAPFSYEDTRDTSNPSIAYQGSGKYEGGVCYRFTTSQNMNVIISHCGSFLSETELYLLDDRGRQINTNFENPSPNDCANSQHAYLEINDLAAGTYYVVSVGGPRNYEQGDITTNIRGEEVVPIPSITEFAEELGAFDTVFFYEDSKDTNTRGVGYPGDGDYRYGVCYRLFLSCIMDLTISHYGSLVADTQLYLLDEAGCLLADNDDYWGTDQCGNPCHAYLAMPKMNPGTYYVVSKAKKEFGEVNTRIMGKPIEGKVGSLDKNYVQTRTYKDDLSGEWLDKVDYFDEMGRTGQSVLVGASPTGGDIVSISEYDLYGRINKTWLPAELKNNKGNYISIFDLSAKVKSAHNEDPSPFSWVNYESSQMNRPVLQYGPGDDWQLKEKAVRTEYQLTNIAGNSVQNCIRYQLSDAAENNDTFITITHAGNYPTGSLQALRKIDEDGNGLIEFSNSSGQIVLSRRISEDESQYYDTYRIYDEWGNLRAVLPPLAADGMKGTEGSWNTLDQVICNYVYLYKYDDRFRMIAKRIPGQDWIRYVYDKAGTPVFTQDGEQRKRGEWTFCITDGLKRTCLTGICNNILRSNSLDVTVNAIRNNTTGTYKGYSVLGVTLTAPRILTVNYYDDYLFMGRNGIPSAFDSNYQYDTLSDYDKRYEEGAHSLLTGTLTAQLSHSGTMNYIPSVMYYDYRGRMIQSKTGTHLAGGVEKRYVSYDFMGNPLKRRYVHLAAGKITQMEEYAYTYDHAGRLLTSKHTLNGKTSIVLADNEYDCIGRLKTNKRNGNAKLKSSYAYNVRSWMKSISNPLFSQMLYYNDKRENGSNIVSYNGNISGMDWIASADNVKRGYDFAYDELSQLVNARYLENDIRDNKFNTSYSYDKQGNFLALSRRGLTESGEYGLLDDLNFTLDGNQLKAINDFATYSACNNGFEFKDKVKLDKEYFYDANGNLTKDLNKNIMDIQYNILNLPNRVEFEDGSYISYLYDASGMKLRAVHNIAGNITTTDYCGNVIYEDGTAKTLLTDAGFVSLSENKYYFYLQDHQGNNRVVADQDGNAEETNHYYPFGGTFASTCPVQPYKYNGKELDTKNGLDWYDYGARHYDAAIGRWHVADPMSEKYYGVSPYVYCGNEPIGRIDPDGRDWRLRSFFNEETGKMEFQISVNSVLYNGSSNQKIDLNKLAKSIMKQINDVYTISGDNFVTTMDFNMTVVNSVDEIEESDHVFQIVDQGQLKDSSSSTKAMAEAYMLGLNVSLGTDLVEDLLAGTNQRSAAHELGHTGGLDDLDSNKKDVNNLMMQGSRVSELGGDYNKSTQLYRSQIETIRDSYIHKKSNRFSPIYRDSSGKKRWK